MYDNAIRKTNLQKLHRLMYQQINKRQYRIKHAPSMKKTDQQWDLIAAAVEQAVIGFHELKGVEAKTMRGRSKTTYRNTTKHVLCGHENEVETEDDTRFKSLSRIANQHTQLGNKLKNISNRMITNAKQIAGQSI